MKNEVKANHMQQPTSASAVDSLGDTVDTSDLTDQHGRMHKTKWRLANFGKPPRIMGIDVARGLAIIGMIGAHVGVTPQLVWSDPTSWGGLINGRSAILFALVAGISIALANGRQTPPVGEVLRSARLKLAGRALAILTFGLVLELLGTSIAVILSVYGALFLFLLPFIGWPRRRLFVAAAAGALLGPVLVKSVLTLTFAGYGPGMSLLVTGIYPITVWLPLMLLGIAIGRCDLTSVRNAVILILGGTALAVIGYGVGNLTSEWVYQGSSSLYSGSASVSSVTMPGEEADLTGLTCSIYEGSLVTCYPNDDMTTFEAGSIMMQTTPGYLEMLRSSGGTDAIKFAVLSSEPHSGGTLEIIGSGGFALAVIGVSLLLSRWLRWVLIPLAAVGSMPLTAYSAHVVSHAILYTPFQVGKSWFGLEMFPENNSIWIGSVIALLVFCTLWAATMGRGPLERVTARVAGAMDQPSTGT